jgi:hypothetical protein
VQECEELGLTGRLPSAVLTLDQQVGARVYGSSPFVFWLNPSEITFAQLSIDWAKARGATKVPRDLR